MIKSYIFLKRNLFRWSEFPFRKQVLHHSPLSTCWLPKRVPAPTWVSPVVCQRQWSPFSWRTVTRCHSWDVFHRWRVDHRPCVSSNCQAVSGSLTLQGTVTQLAARQEAWGTKIPGHVDTALVVIFLNEDCKSSHLSASHKPSLLEARTPDLATGGQKTLVPRPSKGEEVFTSLHEGQRSGVLRWRPPQRPCPRT